MGQMCQSGKDVTRNEIIREESNCLRVSHFMKSIIQGNLIAALRIGGDATRQWTYVDPQVLPFNDKITVEIKNNSSADFFLVPKKWSADKKTLEFAALDAATMSKKLAPMTFKIGTEDCEGYSVSAADNKLIFMNIPSVYVWEFYSKGATNKIIGSFQPAVVPKLPFKYVTSLTVDNGVSGTPTVKLDMRIRPIGIKDVSDRRWGPLKVLNMKTITDDMVFIANKLSGPISAVQGAVQTAMERRNYDPNYFVNLYDFDCQRINDDVDMPMCWQISYYYQYLENDLDKEVKDRIKKGGPSFLGHDLFAILKKMCIAMAFLQSRNAVHGDLSPKSIMIDNKGVPLLMMSKWKPGLDDFQIDFRADMPIYVSPEQFSTLCYDKKTIDQYRSDIFTLGQIMLHAGLLKSVQNIYDRNNKTVRRNTLTKLVEEFVNKYSEYRELCSIVCSCLNFSPELRPDFSKLKADFFSYDTVEDVPKFDLKNTAPHMFVGQNESSMPGIYQGGRMNEISVTAPVPGNKIKSYDDTIKYVPPQIHSGHKDDFTNHNQSVNPYMHLDPHGYLNMSVYPDAMHQSNKKDSEISVYASRNKANIDRLSIGRVSKKGVGEIDFDHQTKEKNVQNARLADMKSRLFERTEGVNVLDQQTMDYHYVKHHQLNARGEPVLNEADTAKMRINLNSGPALIQDVNQAEMLNCTQSMAKQTERDNHSQIFGQYRDINRSTACQLKDYNNNYNEHSDNRGNFDNLNVGNQSNMNQNNKKNEDFFQSPSNHYAQDRNSINLQQGGSPGNQQSRPMGNPGYYSRH